MAASKGPYYVQHQGGDLIGPFGSRADADDYRHSRHSGSQPRAGRNDRNPRCFAGSKICVC